MHDLRYAARILARSPVFTGVAILSLALGIGANTAVFGLVNATLLRYLPVERPDELVSVALEDDDVITNPMWEELRRRDIGLAGIFAFTPARFNLNPAGEVDWVPGLFVSGEFFRTLGIKPHIGRMIESDDDRRGGGAHGPVVVLSYAFWQQRYAANPAALGETIRIEGQPFRIIGVTPPGFFGLTVGQRFDVAAPLSTEPVVYRENSKLDARTVWWLNAMGRLRKPVSVPQTEARLNSLAPDIMEATVPSESEFRDVPQYRKQRFKLKPAQSGISMLRRNYQQSLWVLMTVVGIVLLIACANIANLLLARSSARWREFAVRLALGAGRGRLVRQLLTESVLLAGAGAILGVAVAYWGNRLLIGLISTTDNRVFLDLTPDTRIIFFSIAVTALTALLFGLAPALRSTGIALNDSLKQGSRSVISTGLTLDKTLVVGQIALSLVLLTGGTLFLASFYRLITVERGFQSSGVMLAAVDLTKTNQRIDPGQLIERLRTIPGVRAVSTAEVTPVDGSSWQMNVTGRALLSNDRRCYANRVSPGYFDTIRTPIVAGRDLSNLDTRTSPPVILINRTAARRFFGDSNPIGQTLRPEFPPNSPEYEIIGVVGDSKYRRLNEEIRPTIYFADSQNPKPRGYAKFLVRYDGSDAALTRALSALFGEVNPAITVRYRSLETQVNESIARERLLATLSAFFGGLALLLAVIGIYGLTSFAVSRRRAEIGIRMALGAQRSEILRMVLREAAWLAMAGIIFGAALSVALARYVATLLYGVQATNAQLYTATALLMLFIALLASYVPANRAANLNPMSVLREE